IVKRRGLPKIQSSGSWSNTTVGLGLCRLFLHAGQRRAALPEQQGSFVVLGPRRRRNRRGLVKVLSRRIGHGRRRREMDDRLCALIRGYREKLGKPNERRDQTAALVAITRGVATVLRAS